jgi:hypothetical protein
VVVEPEAVDDLLVHLLGVPPELMAPLGQGDRHVPLVERRAIAAHQVHRVEPFEQRGQRAGVERQQRAQILHLQWSVLPQGHHREVLRVGETERGEQRLVGGHHAAGRDRQGVADLLLQVEGVDLFLFDGHAGSRSTED